MGRDNFSYEGARALMEYLEAVAEDTGEPVLVVNQAKTVVIMPLHV